jgi:formamidopyrimidine-DNA glycosylase
MPELPEVEIHARNLRRWLAGERVAGCEVLDPLLIEGQDAAPWHAVAGREILGVRREAKYLLIDLAGALTLVAHLRMTGRFVHDPYSAGPPEKPTRLVLDLEGGGRVRFEDRRRFGRAWLAQTGRVGELPELAGLGPDALLAPTSYERLREWTRRSGRSIKTLLMDQRVIGGLGNICAIEILYRTGISPARPARDLTDEQVRDVARTIPAYLEWAIEVQSRRELIYLGEKGAENVFSIYRRAGAACPKCGSAIARTVIAGRGTFHCPGCQPGSDASG